MAGSHVGRRQPPVCGGAFGEGVRSGCAWAWKRVRLRGKVVRAKRAVSRPGWEVLRRRVEWCEGTEACCAWARVRIRVSARDGLDQHGAGVGGSGSVEIESRCKRE